MPTNPEDSQFPVASGLWLENAPQEVYPQTSGIAPSFTLATTYTTDALDKRLAALEGQVLSLQRLIEGIIRRVGIDRFAEIVKEIEDADTSNYEP